MITSSHIAELRQHLHAGRPPILFLDYDGTLVPIARTPEQARPDKELLALLTKLVNTPTLETIILSGRPLASLQTFLPISGLTLAGTYGVEIYRAGKVMTRGVDLEQIRPVIEQIKSKWEHIIEGYKGFLLEDKGLAIALHARWATPLEAQRVLETAHDVASLLLPTPHFRFLGGDRFLEVVPLVAHKGYAVNWLLDQINSPGAFPIYFGDDDKDEESFSIIHSRGGVSVGVGTRFPLAQAMMHVASPEVVRDWLNQFLLELNGDQPTVPPLRAKLG